MDEEISREKWVRIMCDYCADGVWAKSGGGFDASELPISRALLEQLRAWQAWYQRREVDDPAWPDLDAFSAEGERIAQAVKAELPNWTVFYFHEAKAEACLRGIPAIEHHEHPRDPFEYEIFDERPPAEPPTSSM